MTVESPHDHDETLWVVVTDVPGRCFLGGNAHTHLGHIHAWSEDLGKLMTIRKDDVIDASPQARIWIQGFLTGNEPSLAEWLCVTPDEAFVHERHDDPKFQEWKRELRRFRQRGWMPLGGSSDSTT
jgi:hypothetical protein